jgi:DNA-directed RNA polymerase specialized sigma24 family protein
LRKVAVILNGLDFREREKFRDSGLDRAFFRRLAKPEQILFFELTYEESIKRMMEALDGLSPEDRKKFVEKGLKELEEGLAQEDMARMKELGDDLLERAAKEGFQEFMQTASAETKMDLAPLMEAMNEAMQGLRGQEWE